MKNKTGMTPHCKNILLISLAALNAAESAETAESAELLLQTATFLARYAFLLEPKSEEADFLKPKKALTGEIHAQNAHAARYRDPKYSMWLSADPALGEYIPAAPVSDEARRHNENLPGMGGVYNYVNFNLYHYAGNNPVKYVDPDGRLDITSFYIPDFCSMVKGTDNKLVVPIGGDLTSDQKDITKIQGLLTLGFSMLPGVGSFTAVPGSDFSVDTSISLLETVVCMVAEKASMGLTLVDLLKIIAAEPSVEARNYSSDQIDFIGKCAIEQLFIKDYYDELEKNGIATSIVKQGSFIMNLEIRDVPLGSTCELVNIAQKVKESNPLYKDVEINY